MGTLVQSIGDFFKIVSSIFQPFNNFPRADIGSGY